MLSLYTIDKTIGRGSYGHVYKVTKKDTGNEYAMKKININSMSHYEKINIINELRILATHKCPFIVKFKSAFVHNTNMYIVTEYATKGDLSLLIKKNKNVGVRFAESQIWSYFLQTCIALSYLHNLKIIHRDLKPANIFIDRDDNIKLGDFGVIKIMKSFMMYGQTQIGTPLYMCPEIYKNERYDAKVDIWALGCVLYEMMTLRTAFHAINIIQLKKHIFEGKVEQIQNDTYSKELHNMLKKLICVLPRQRPTIAFILNTKFIHAQLRLRKLQFLDTCDIEPAFHVNCVIPKSLFAWNNIVEMFVSINATVMLSDAEQCKMDEINHAKKNIDTLSKQTFELIDVNTQIKKIHDEILKAMKYVNECEAMLKKLNERKQIIEHVLNHRAPIPPATALPTKRPRK